MLTLTTGLAALSCLAASLLLYLGCPNQQWVGRRPLAFYPALALSLLGLCTSFWLFNQQQSTLAALFSALSFFMLTLGLWPFLARLPLPSKHSARQQSFKLQKATRAEIYQPEWALKIASLFVLGLPLALSTVGLLAFWAPGPVTNDTKSQLVMWLVTPLWLTLLSLGFFSLSWRRLLQWGFGLNLAAWLLLTVARSTHG